MVLPKYTHWWPEASWGNDVAAKDVEQAEQFGLPWPKWDLPGGLGKLVYDYKEKSLATDVHRHIYLRVAVV